ncbi:uncharacterized protein LOC123517579 [Portunus trituberculatus]|uniref:uncharacterized protein LOC123517579 n=1 Tax=Portunus trituberculatus TaxID=210409 RepID=UPI001E1D1C54|nr:uncharacterized protein LOC123517579 [Portunus trituberculatus]XP_045133771.1 uncharacterized protein LOC123517579 [Portunus trituberculatus]XP_045133772.1 uncharacterized protein LOC123517579 [Portunus trituberculatus]
MAGHGSSSIAAYQTLLTLMLMAVVTGHTMGHTYMIRRGDEPFIYKNIASRYPHMFTYETTTVGATTSGDEMKMLLGMCKEDRQVVMTKLPVNSTVAATQNTTDNDVLNTIENMVEVIKMEDMSNSKEKMLPGLKKMVDSINSTMKLQTRMSPQTSKQTLINLQQTVLEFLAISGIEALLPLDCGKNPKSPLDPVPSRGIYPWIAALGSSEDGRFHYRCIGVLITQQHILTDADCVTSPNINVVMMNVTDAPGPGAVLNYVAGRRIHPAIKSSEDLLSGNNIGILELALPYEFNDDIQPLCLAGQFEEPDPNERSEVTIIGYQVTDTPTGRMAGLYNWPKSRTLGSAFCYVAIKSLKAEEPDIKTTLEDILTKQHLCVDRNFDLVGKSVILKVDENTGRVRVVGLGGVANASKTNPIAYTLVQPHRFWIELILKKFRDNTTPKRPTSPSPDSDKS